MSPNHTEKRTEAEVVPGSRQCHPSPCCPSAPGTPGSAEDSPAAGGKLPEEKGPSENLTHAPVSVARNSPLLRLLDKGKSLALILSLNEKLRPREGQKLSLGHMAESGLEAKP